MVATTTPANPPSAVADPAGDDQRPAVVVPALHRGAEIEPVAGIVAVPLEKRPIDRRSRRRFRQRGCQHVARSVEQEQGPAPGTSVPSSRASRHAGAQAPRARRRPFANVPRARPASCRQSRNVAWAWSPRARARLRLAVWILRTSTARASTMRHAVNPQMAKQTRTIRASADPAGERPPGRKAVIKAANAFSIGVTCP